MFPLLTCNTFYNPIFYVEYHGNNVNICFSCYTSPGCPSHSQHSRPSDILVKPNQDENISIIYAIKNRAITCITWPNHWIKFYYENNILLNFVSTIWVELDRKLNIAYINPFFQEWSRCNWRMDTDQLWTTTGDAQQPKPSI